MQQYQSRQEEEYQRWRQQQLGRMQWHLLLPQSVQQSSGATSEVLPDRSVLTRESKGKTVTEVISATDLTGVSSLRLEVLADQSLPGGGPGLNPENGNFVLTELEVEIAPNSDPEAWRPVPIASALADFEQQNYSVNLTIDGQKTGTAGWALAGGTGKSRWATYHFQLPVGFAGGSRIRVRMTQDFDLKHMVGRFRLALASLERPVGLGLSDELLTQLVTPSPNEEIKQRLLTAFQRGDERRVEIDSELAAARMPLTIDQRIIEARAALGLA